MDTLDKNTPVKKTGLNITQFILNLLYSSLIISALVGIGAIMFGNDEYGDRAFSTIGLLIVVDIVLLLGLLTKYHVYRYLVWGFGVLAFSFTTAGIWSPRPGPVYNDFYPYDIVDRDKVFSEYLLDIGGALWLMTLTLVLLSVFSLLKPWIDKINSTTRIFYWVLQGVAIIGTLPLMFFMMLSRNVNTDYSIPLKIYASAFILSSTIVLILGIASLYKVISDSNNKKNMNRLDNVQSDSIPSNYQTQQEEPAQYENHYSEHQIPLPNAGYTLDNSRNPHANDIPRE